MTIVTPFCCWSRASSWPVPFSFARSPLDDAYIVARYAVNARDLGRMGIQSRRAVSALTSPLHGLLSSGCHAASDPVPLYKAFRVPTVAAASADAGRSYGLTAARQCRWPRSSWCAPGMILWTFGGTRDAALDGDRHGMAAVYATGRPGDAQTAA